MLLVHCHYASVKWTWTWTETFSHSKYHHSISMALHSNVGGRSQSDRFYWRTQFISIIINLESACVEGIKQTKIETSRQDQESNKDWVCFQQSSVLSRLYKYLNAVRLRLQRLQICWKYDLKSSVKFIQFFIQFL